VALRPLIGPLLPVFVRDRYEGFDAVKTFVELTDGELAGYLDANAATLRAANEWHDSQAAIVGHAVPGAAVAARALGPGAYVVKIHGSDVEYAIRAQERYRRLAGEGLGPARVAIGASRDVVERCRALVPGMTETTAVVSPGVDVAAFHPIPRRAALLDVAARLAGDPEIAAGRPSALDEEVRRALAARDADALDGLAAGYDQAVPDPDAPQRLTGLADLAGPIVGYFGKLIPQKGVELLLSGSAHVASRPTVLIVGFGSHREWLAALAMAQRDRDADAIAWLGTTRGMPVEAPPSTDPGAVVFTGRLDHRYAPGSLAAMDVLVVPSILEEAFGMVAAEGAAAGALPLVARHSGLAEVAGALETEAGRPGVFSFDPGDGAIWRIRDGIDRLLALPGPERDELRRAVSGFVAREWSWEGTARRLLQLAS
jgi:glycosyltransferase involved in cell wall biosynthesis